MPAARRRTPARPPRARKTKARSVKSAKSSKWVYLFAEGNARSSDLLGGKGANLAEMTRLGAAGAARLHRHHRGLQRLPRRRRRFPTGSGSRCWRRSRELEQRDRQALRRPGEPAARLLPLGREVLDARHDGHGAQHRPERRGRRGARASSPATRASSTTPTAAWCRCSARVVLGLPDEPFEEVLDAARASAGVANDADLAGRRPGELIAASSRRSSQRTPGSAFPQDPREQLRLATEAVFRSWNGKRAIDYRNAAGIAHDLGTAVNIVHHGVRQHGRRLRHRRRDDPQRHHRRARASRATT